ncbi:hypothetical protein A1O1_06115 [Capronia coronata CBS 617.96]|uniref:Zn(2)-C6 fungal-type domain-containing protein n=1 Tax=Capronia coronata CBS 617.96 TaxID=1182541 RepID=W9XYW0_9EURO|nr:uncharacterized protein A1O1_06115 [Capronia coronata CBS 617.96]EXJ85747.1 hypothetical protein A1O1_06115 [Capronia coronata CBS 617.96]
MAGDGKSAPPTASGESGSRQRKTHRKSRLGCRNCKLRRVKCDEKKPGCQKCLSFDVVCNYDPNIPDLQPRGPASAEMGCMNATTTMERSLLSANRPTLKWINSSLQEDPGFPLVMGRYTAKQQIDYSDLALMDRFQTRTVLTIGTRSASHFLRKELIQLACCNRFLMHLVQSLTAAHDRFLSGAALSKRTATEVYHMSQGVRAFQYKLSRPIRDQDRDAVFVAASIVGVLTFAIEASSIEQVWPLGEGDFAWLNISEGKKAVWQVANPLREDSVWRGLGRLYARNTFAMSKSPKQRPSVFGHLCGDDDAVESEESDGASSPVSMPFNPYRKTALILTELLDLDCDDSTWNKFLAFIAQVDPCYKVLLQAKDPWAMLMLAYWFVKICRAPWWIATRAIIQGQAICLYLERYHADDARLQEAIQYPRKELDLAQREGYGGFP